MYGLVYGIQQYMYIRPSMTTEVCDNNEIHYDISPRFRILYNMPLKLCNNCIHSALHIACFFCATCLLTKLVILSQAPPLMRKRVW